VRAPDGTGLVERGLEGLVFLVYRPGKRSKDWVKAKCPAFVPIILPGTIIEATRWLLVDEPLPGGFEVPAVIGKRTVQ
jgi:hypothetical protein